MTCSIVTKVTSIECVENKGFDSIRGRVDECVRKENFGTSSTLLHRAIAYTTALLAQLLSYAVGMTAGQRVTAFHANRLFYYSSSQDWS